MNQLEIRYRDIRQTRHSYAANTLGQGEKPNFVAQQMGHASLQMLYERYAKYMKFDNEDTIDTA